MFEGRGRYEGEGRFRAWLFTVATRIAFDRRRSARRREALAPMALHALLPGVAEDPARAAETADLVARVESALADLSPAHAQTFYLRVREEWSYREIAEVVGDPEGTLRSRVHHVLRRVRSMLETGTAHDERAREKERRP